MGRSEQEFVAAHGNDWGMISASNSGLPVDVSGAIQLARQQAPRDLRGSSFGGERGKPAEQERKPQGRPAGRQWKRPPGRVE